MCVCFGREGRREGVEKLECLQRHGEGAAAGVRTFQRHDEVRPQQEKGGMRGRLNQIS